MPENKGATHVAKVPDTRLAVVGEPAADGQGTRINGAAFCAWLHTGGARKVVNAMLRCVDDTNARKEEGAVKQLKAPDAQNNGE